MGCSNNLTYLTPNYSWGLFFRSIFKKQLNTKTETSALETNQLLSARRNLSFERKERLHLCLHPMPRENCFKCVTYCIQER